MIKKKLLLIGKYSFISSNLYLSLKNKLIIKKVSFEKFKKFKIKKIESFDYICNCSIHKKYINERYKNNNDIDYYVVKRLKNLSPKFIFLSSRKIYPSKPNLNENTFPNPRDSYSKNKLITENKIKKYLNSKLIILRISNIIGKPLKKSNRKVSQTFIDNFFKYRKNQKVIYENHYKDFLSIDQFSKIFYEILIRDPIGIFNISLGKKVYISEILKVLNLKRSIKFEKVDIKNKDSFYLNNKKLKKLIKIKITKMELLDYCSKI